MHRLMLPTRGLNLTVTSNTFYIRANCLWRTSLGSSNAPAHPLDSMMGKDVLYNFGSVHTHLFYGARFTRSAVTRLTVQLAEAPGLVTAPIFKLAAVMSNVPPVFRT